MLILLSPAKKLDYDTPSTTTQQSQPEFVKEAHTLIKALKKLSASEIGDLMKLSPALSDLNFARYKEWKPAFTTSDSKQSALAFNGEVYTGLSAETFSESEFEYAQSHLRILSGLYGLLRPLDLIRPYRLEMGTKFAPKEGQKNLYDFWGDTITKAVNKALGEQGDDVLVNLASNEYFKSVKKKQLEGRVITPTFKDFKNGSYKTIMVFAKKARGTMASWVIRNQVESLEMLQTFSEDGYVFNPELSRGDDWCFTRG